MKRAFHCSVAVVCIAALIEVMAKTHMKWQWPVVFMMVGVACALLSATGEK